MDEDKSWVPTYEEAKIASMAGLSGTKMAQISCVLTASWLGRFCHNLEGISYHSTTKDVNAIKLSV